MSSTPAICTIIAKNYLAQARVLCASFLDHHPGGRCYTLVIDDYAGYIHPPAEQFTLVSLAEILPRELHRTFCFKYNLTELATAVKPILLTHLLNNLGLEKVLYLDPDILVTGTLEGLFQTLNTWDMIVTPHLDQDFPDDRLTPSLSSMLVTGAFNLGFLGIRKSPESERFLEWFWSKTKRFCYISASAGYFVDQKFFDVAITLFPSVYIERSTSYNAAPWNLHSRFLSRQGGTWTCNNNPLSFYHFSNYKPKHPDVIASYVTRQTFTTRPDVKMLYDQYRELLVKKGYGTFDNWSYSYNRFKNGSLIAYLTRSFFRNSEKLQNSIEDPFSSRFMRIQNRMFSLLEMICSYGESAQTKLKIFIKKILK